MIAVVPEAVRREEIRNRPYPAADLHHDLFVLIIAVIETDASRWASELRRFIESGER